MYCPFCDRVTVCSAHAPNFPMAPGEYLQSAAGHPDLHWFRRSRICTTCNESFHTAEIYEKHIHELIQLRDGLGDLAKSVEALPAQVSRRDD